MNCVPQSDVRLFGTLNQAIQPRMRALAQEMVVMSASGTTSGHLDYRSTMVNR